MPQRIEIKVDKESLRQARSLFNDLEKAPPIVTSRAINRTLTGVRTDITKGVGEILNVKQKRIRDTIRLKKATYNEVTGVVTIEAVRIPLIEFAASWKQAWPGAKAKVEKREKRKTYKHAFIRFSKGWGRKAVFWRAIDKKTGKRAGRLPIKEVYGPSVADYLAKPEIMEPVQEKAGQRIVTNMQRELDYYLLKHG